MDSEISQLKCDKVRLSILDYIVREGLQVGERLPPERSFSQLLDCSSGTMRIALKVLEGSGLIETRHGLGSYLRRKVSDLPAVGRVLWVSVLRDQGAGTYPSSDVRRYFTSLGMKVDYHTIMEFGDLPLSNLGGCMGILLTGWVTDDLVRNMQTLGIPLIVAGNRPLTVSVPTVKTNIRKAAYRLTRYYLARGHQRIAFWAGEKDYQFLQEAEEGYAQAMEEKGLPWKEMVMAWDRRSPLRRVESFIRQHRDLEAFICEYPAFTEFGQVLCKDRTLPFPDFGILALLSSGFFLRSEHLMVADYPRDYLQVAAEQLYGKIIRDIPMKSITIDPIIHGLDDDIEEF